MHQLTKIFFYNIKNILKEIIAELPDYEISDPVNSKRTKFALLIYEETWVVSCEL